MFQKESSEEKSSDEMVFVRPPKPLKNKIKKLLDSGAIENPGDAWLVGHLFKYEETITQAGVTWLTKLLERKGKKFK
jgi:hypothetical protein